MNDLTSSLAATATFANVHPASISSLSDDGLIELTALRPFVPFHPQHIRKLIKKGLFPAPVKVPGCRRTVFLRRDIGRYLEGLSK
jgi:hypothetical protein